jgi:FkbM family methyltransferase
VNTFVSYAQNFEDVLLWRALKDVESGFYIDIGANSPVIDSVSLAFYEQGWRGINVEPSLEYIVELREQREKDSNVHAAIADERGLLTFYDIPETGLSTLLREVADRHAESGFEVRETSVPVITLDDLLEKVPGTEVHWMKIDVEGAEQRVLQGWKTSPIRPWVVVVESVEPATHGESHFEWESILHGKGYQFAHFDGLNRYFVSENHPELMDAFRLGPNVFDRFTLSGTATSTFCALVSYKLSVAVERGQLALVAANQASLAQWTAREQALSESVRQSQLDLEESHRAGSALQAALLEAEAEKNALRKQTIETLSEYRSLIRDRDQAKEALNEQGFQFSIAKAEIEALRAEQSALIAELQDSSARTASRDAAVRALEERVALLLNSTSWKVTGPLRLLSSVLRGSRNEASIYLRETLRALSEMSALRAFARRVLPANGRMRRALAARIVPVSGVMTVSPAALTEIGTIGAATSERDRLFNKMAGGIRDHRLRKEGMK